MLPFTTSIAQRLASLRKQKGLTQHALADAFGPQTLRVTTDSLIFEPEDLEPDEDLRLQFKAVSNMPPEAERWSSKRRASG